MNRRYQEAMTRLRNYLAEQKPADATRLPSEREFAELFGISRPTVNKAIACLVAEGVLRREGYKLYLAGDVPPPAGPPAVMVLIPQSLMVNREGPLDAARDVGRERLSHTIPLLTRDAVDERETLTRLLSQKISGFAIWPHGPDCNADLLAEFRRQGTPFVVCDQDLDAFDFVGTDNEAGTAMAVRHLVERGHRDLAYLTRQMVFPSLARRCAGYRQACQAAGLPRAAEQIVEISEEKWVRSRADVVAEAFAMLRRRFSKATAFAASNDVVVMEVFKAARAAGMRIPQQLSAVGFDDIAAAAQVTPALTTIRQDFYEIGYLATQLLYQRMTRIPQREPLQPVQLLLKPRLIVRDSVTTLKARIP